MPVGCYQPCGEPSRTSRCSSIRAIWLGLKVATDYDKDERNQMADTYTVEREIRIDAPASAVYERIVDFHRWPAWSP